MVTINTNQKFGYHKDTPFIIVDSKSGKLAMEFNKNTKSVFTNEKSAKIMGNHQITAKEHQSTAIAQKIFTKMCDAATSLEN